MYIKNEVRIYKKQENTRAFGFPHQQSRKCYFNMKMEKEFRALTNADEFFYGAILFSLLNCILLTLRSSCQYNINLECSIL